MGTPNVSEHCQLILNSLLSALLHNLVCSCYAKSKQKTETTMFTLSNNNILTHESKHIYLFNTRNSFLTAYQISLFYLDKIKYNKT